jgi:hypothetical protein
MADGVDQLKPFKPKRKKRVDPGQDDLFSEEVTLRIPAQLALEGRVLGSLVRQQLRPERLVPCRLKPVTVRRRQDHSAVRRATRAAD